MKSRDILKKAAVSTKSETLMRSYRETRNRVNSLNNSLKKKFYNDRISQHSGNMKETWKLANELLKKRNKSTNINSLYDGYMKWLAFKGQWVNLLLKKSLQKHIPTYPYLDNITVCGKAQEEHELHLLIYLSIIYKIEKSNLTQIE